MDIDYDMVSTVVNDDLNGRDIKNAIRALGNLPPINHLGTNLEHPQQVTET